MSLFSRRMAPTPDQARSAGGYFMSSSQLTPTRPPFATGGQPVTPYTALQKVALLAGTNLVANAPVTLPLETFTGSGGNMRPVPKPSVIADPEGQGYGLGDFGYKFLASMMLRGNAFIRVDAIDARGKPSVVTLLDPDQISVKRNAQTGVYEFKSVEGDPMLPFAKQPQGGIIHRRAFAQPGQALGLSIVANHARTIGSSIAAEQFGADFFADGAHPTGILTNQGKDLSQEQAKTAKDRFLSAIRGTREPAVLGNGWAYQQIQVAPNESQFLETQKFTSAEICRMIGPGVAEMLGYETGGAMTYQNIQSRSLHVLQYAIDPWLVHLESLLSDMFMLNPQFCRFDRSQFLRMTAGDRWAVNSSRLKLGAATINEVRAEENELPVPWGDEPYLPSFGPAPAAAELNNDLALDAEAAL